MKWFAPLLASVLSTVILAPAAISSESRTEAAAESSRGTIRWHDCSAANLAAGANLTGFKCGILTVPLDWDDLENPANAEIEMAIHRAMPKVRIGALTINPGGPGGSGLGAAAWQFSALPSTVTTSFDFVAWDPRGVGLSQPQLTNCSLPESTFPAPTGPVDWSAYVNERYRIVGSATSACLAKNVDVAPYLGTYYVIRDLEALRLALGFRKWNFIGQSYGSRIGYWYAREFPQNIRALVLDASYSPTLTATSNMNQTANRDLTTQTVFSSLFGNRMGYRLQRIFDALNEREVVIDSHTVNRWQILNAFFTMAMYQWNYPDLIDQINSTYTALFVTDDATNNSLDSPLLEWASFTKEGEAEALLIPVVNCRDLSDYPSIEETTIAAEAAARINMHSAWEAVTAGAMCAGFPSDFFHGLLPAKDTLELPSGAVVINSLGDASLNYVGARTMANYLSNSALITYNSTQHVTYPIIPSPCVNNAVTRYLVLAKTPTSRFCDYVKFR